MKKTRKSVKNAAAPCVAAEGARLAEFAKILKKRRLDGAFLVNQANVRALTGIDCDNALLAVRADGGTVFHTDFRYIPMAHRVAPWLKTKDIKTFNLRKFFAPEKGGARASAGSIRIGFESCLSVQRFEKFQKNGGRKFEFVDVLANVFELRAVKTAAEVERLRAAAALNDEIWKAARKEFRPGMTERQMARIIRHMMIERGDGEAFDTIVCVGPNAAECHHVPDDTAWDGKQPVLVDMGVRLDGYCSDMTRNIVPRKGPTARYREVYEAVLSANLAAIAAAKPGITAAALDKVARDVLAKRGLAKAFGHSLGHGVGIEIHEFPAIAQNQKKKTILKPGMVHSIEPGVYLENELGVRIEDLVLITPTGCELLSHSEK